MNSARHKNLHEIPETFTWAVQNIVTCFLLLNFQTSFELILKLTNSHGVMDVEIFLFSLQW